MEKSIPFKFQGHNLNWNQPMAMNVGSGNIGKGSIKKRGKSQKFINIWLLQKPKKLNRFLFTMHSGRSTLVHLLPTTCFHHHFPSFYNIFNNTRSIVDIGSKNSAIIDAYSFRLGWNFKFSYLEFVVFNNITIDHDLDGNWHLLFFFRLKVQIPITLICCTKKIINLN